MNDAITVNGFLPATQPLPLLPNSYYKPWEDLMEILPGLIKSGQLRDQVDELPILSTNELHSEPEWRRAYVILTFLASGYIWGGDKAAEILPASVAVPLLKVSGHLEILPIATYTSLNLWNFAAPHDDFTDLDSLRPLHTFSGTDDEAWFYLVSVAMEAEGARMEHLLLQNMQAIQSQEYGAIIEFLEELITCIRKLKVLLDRMYERCDPKIFFFGFRPFLAGSMNMAAAGLPNGIFYSQGNGRGVWLKLRGGSNAQSPLVQLLDILLGIEHASDGDHAGQAHSKAVLPRKMGFHEEVRRYMPGPHQRFLKHVSKSVRLRELVKSRSDALRHAEFQRTYKVAIQVLTEFRNKHLQIVTRYIVLPSKLRNVGSNERVNLSVPAQPETELTGAGGTNLMPFLKQTRDETVAAGKI